MSEATVVLKNRRPTILGLVTGHKLLPKGKVEVPLATYEEKLKTDPTFISFIKLGWVNVQGAPAPAKVVVPGPDNDDDMPESLADMEPADAKMLINATSQVSVLKAWKDAEKRKGVAKMLAARLGELTADDSKEEIFGADAKVSEDPEE